ncbi:hypothetical protein HF526_07440 [Pseudonocardia sp. K10HN5]|uniref:Uncharacterized protein n=1 Tax=Pseudonocardia acidicola TaxID=2724939 RepID=A0ABX1S8K9_9PSEU|nr:hypothetical protein [Pseudonocardia acidicola]
MIEIIPGRPERRYCTAAHRSAARQARRASAQSEGDARLAEALPWLREPEESMVRSAAGVHRPAPAASPPGPPPRARRRAVPRLRGPRPGDQPRRRRALAVLGAAGLLVGGYSITASESPAPAETPVRAAPEEATEEQWAARAQVALSSVNRQLDTIAQTEETWSRVPDSRRVGGPPAPVRALRERKALLERQRATLQSQLAAYRSLEQTADELKLAEQHLAAIEKALADLPPEGRRSPEQAAAIAALNEQRDIRIRQRDAKREELRSLADGVQSARRTALPEDSRRTTEVSDAVLALSKDPGSGGAPTGPATTRRPEAIGGRDEEDTRPRAEVGTSGPPDPRGPRDETREERRQRGAGESGDRGPVGAVVGAVGGVVGGGTGVDAGETAEDEPSKHAAASGARGGRAGGKAADKPSRGPAADTVGAVTGPVTDALPGRESGGGSGRAGNRGGGSAAADDRREARGADSASRTGERATPRSSPAAAPDGGSSGGTASGSRSGTAAEQNDTRRAPAATGSAGTQAPRPSGSEGIASAVAGPAVRAMTPAWAAPYADAGLRQADREAAARMAEAGSGSSNATASSSSSSPGSGRSSADATDTPGTSASSPVQRGDNTGEQTNGSDSGASNSSAGDGSGGPPARDIVTAGSAG